MVTVYSNSTPPAAYNVTDRIFNKTHVNETSSPCRVLKFSGVVPSNIPDNLVSAETEDMVHRVDYTVVLPILFLIGGPANVINMAVFYRQGLKERINVCLFSLSLVDFLYLFFNVVLYAEEAYRQIVTHFTSKLRFGPHIRFMVNHNLLGFFGLSWVSQVISAIIASERCFCVLWPLRSQTILSTSTTTVIIVITGVVILGLYSLEVTNFRIACAHDPLTKSDSWIIVPSQFYLDNEEFIKSLNVYVFGFGISVVMMVVVMVTTMVTMVKLRQAAAWRAGSSSSSSVSAREVGVTVMLVYNSIFFVCCAFPSVLIRILTLFIPDLAVGSRQHNLFALITWLLDMVTYINATFNIVIYYTMGSRYRQIFWQILGRSIKSGERMRQSKTANTTTSGVWALGTEG